MSLESYAHSTAKHIFADWLREIAAEAWSPADGNPCVRLGDLYWRVNRPAPHYGVWVEYPIGRGDYGNHNIDGIVPVWDEYYTVEPMETFDDWTDWTTAGRPPSDWEHAPPTYEELISLGRPPAFIADIAVQHKGSICHIIEIVHKHPPSATKLDAYRLLNINTWVIPTAWVLGQVKRPTKIPAEFCF